MYTSKYEYIREVKSKLEEIERDIAELEEVAKVFKYSSGDVKKLASSILNDIRRLLVVLEPILCDPPSPIIRLKAQNIANRILKLSKELNPKWSYQPQILEFLGKEFQKLVSGESSRKK